MEQHELGLGLAATPQPQPVTPVLPAEPKRPGIAFLLSLFLPGSGQIYAGAKRRGGWTLAFFLLAFIVTVALASAQAPLNNVSGAAARAMLALYVFSFLDAYFTAREVNTGIYPLKPYNARLAAVLNFTTRGFGYWHVDERKLAILFFIVVGIVDRAGQVVSDTTGTVLGWVAELMLAALAFHAWHVATRKNGAALANMVQPVAPLQPESGLRPWLPVGFAGFIAFAFYGLALLGTFMPDAALTESSPEGFVAVDQSQASITETPNGKLYANAKYGAEFHIPGGWNIDQADPTLLATAIHTTEDCRVTLAPGGGYTGSNVEVGNQLVSELELLETEFQLVERKSTQLAGGTAHEITFTTAGGSGKLHRTYVIARRGSAAFLLHSSVAEKSAAACAADVQQMRERLIIPRTAL